MMKMCVTVLAASAFLFAGAAFGAEYFVAPDGKADAAGTAEAPWDIISALSGKQAVQPGDTVWLKGGTYRCEQAYKTKGQGFKLSLSGAKDKPVIVRAARGERVIIDGGLVVSGSYVWLWDLEIAQPPDVPAVTEIKGSHPDLGNPLGGLQIYAGEGSKFINLVLHHNIGGGIGWWNGVKNGEVYGCIIVNNGWKGPDRNHGHCIYTQNQEGIKTVRNCIMTTRWPGGHYTMHAYGSRRAYVDNFVIEDNIAWRHGPFLVGGGRPSQNITVRRNYLYKVPMQIGYSAPHNENCEIADNVVFRSRLSVKRYTKGVVSGNLVVAGGMSVGNEDAVEQKDNEVLKDKLPDEPRIVLLPNQYDPARAHLAIFNWQKKESVRVPAGDFLKPGDAFRLMDPLDFYGKPVFEGKCEGKTITVPLKDEFAVFVVMK